MGSSETCVDSIAARSRGVLIREIYNVDYLCNRVWSGERLWGVETGMKRGNSQE